MVDVNKLEAVSRQLDNLAATLWLSCSQGPHKPDHRLLK